MRTTRRMLRTLCGSLITVAVLGGAEPVEAQAAAGFRNLHVLPEGITRAEMNATMLANLSGLGLPRRANEGCLFCHVGSMDVPSSEWDWSADDNPMKRKARTMMAMVADINDTYLARIERTTQGDVTCYTCHAGRTNPMPLHELLTTRYREAGIEALIESYRSLRSRYYAADAYDFRTATLGSVAAEIVRTGSYEDAARVHEVNIEYTDDPAARQGLIRMRMVEALETDGIDAMLATYRRLRADHPAEAYSPLLLDPLAWELFRAGQEDAGFRLFLLNYEEHPDSYVATEDLAWGHESLGNHDEAIAVAEAWLERHPGHELGLRLLAELQR